MSYQTYVVEEHDPTLLAMFEWVTFDNEVEDTAGFTMSEPMATDEILIRNRSIINNEVTSLWLTPDRTEPIVFAPNSYSSGNFTLLGWVYPYDSAGGYRGVLEYGPLRVIVTTVGEENFTLRLEVGGSNAETVLDVGMGYNFMVVRSGDNFDFYVDNSLIQTLTVAGQDFSTAGVSIGTATGWTTDPQAELDVQGVTIIPAALTTLERDDLWSVIENGYISRTVSADTEIDFASEDTVVLQTEWHSVLVD